MSTFPVTNPNFLSKILWWRRCVAARWWTINYFWLVVAVITAWLARDGLHSGHAAWSPLALPTKLCFTIFGRGFQHRGGPNREGLS